MEENQRLDGTKEHEADYLSDNLDIIEEMHLNDDQHQTSDNGCIDAGYNEEEDIVENHTPIQIIEADFEITVGNKVILKTYMINIEKSNEKIFSFILILECCIVH